MVIEINDAGLHLPDGTVAAAIPSQPAADLPGLPGIGFDAEAYCNAVSLLEDLCFPPEECQQVVRSRKLRKRALQRQQVPHLFGPSDSVRPMLADVPVPPDWSGVRAHGDLNVPSWLERAGTWGAFDVKAACVSWQQHNETPSKAAPSVEELRAHGYLLRLFSPCASLPLQRSRLLAILRQPHTALAQYLVQHSVFWRRPENANRLDEVQEHFQGMDVGEFRRQAAPPILLARLARAARSRRRRSGSPFRCLRLVECCVREEADLRVELITSPEGLDEAAAKLRNCAGGEGYHNKAEKGECLLLVLKQGGKLAAMAEWCTVQQRFLQLVEHCNGVIRPEWESLFNEAAKLLPKKVAIMTSSHHPFTHSTCHAPSWRR